MANLRQIALNANSGLFVNILATLPATRYEAMEDEAGNTEGIQVQTPLDGFVTTNTFSFGSEPVRVPSDPAVNARPGRVWGFPAQGQAGAFNARNADLLMSARSNGAQTTVLRFIEWE